MQLLSWNVNGIRAILNKGFADFLTQQSPDMLCLQEVRAERAQVVLPDHGYEVFWNAAQRKGYAGTAILSRYRPMGVTYGLGIADLDTEGRVITLEYPSFFLVTVYTPNAGQQLDRLQYRHRQWDPAFLTYVKHLETRKPVIFCGDLNVAHQEIDLARPRENVGNAGFTPEEREGFDCIVASGFIDTFREFCQDSGHYSWWSYRGRAREKNIGWRIDYFCISPALRPALRDASILSDVVGSDHCPVTITLDDSLVSDV